MFLVIFMYALFAASLTASKMILAYTQPIFLAGSRMSIAGIILLAYHYFHPREKFSFDKKHLWTYAHLIFFGIYCTYIPRYWGLQYINASKAGFLYNFSPFFAALYTYILFKEKMTTCRWIGLVVGFLGMIPILSSTSKVEQSLGEIFFVSWPELAIIASVAASSYSWVLMGKMVRDHGCSPTMVNAISMSIGGLSMLGLSFAVEPTVGLEQTLPFMGLLSFIVIISNIICHNLYGVLLRTYTATFLSFSGFMSPIFTAFYSWFLIGEQITWHFYVASVIVFAGLYLFYRDELRENHIRVQ